MSTPQPPVAAVTGLTKWYPVYRPMIPTWLQSRPLRYIKAVDGVTFQVAAGEILGLAGESGSGKSTTAELLIKLQEPTAGTILYKGEPIAGLSGSALQALRRRVQMVVQDPYQSLNPHFSVERLVEEPLAIHRLGTPAERQEQVRRTLEDVGLRPASRYLDRRPHQLSGGERQRVSIARALVLNPEFLVLDEPTSMLDVSLRAGVLNLLQRLREKYGLTMVVISHDIGVLRYLCETIAILYRGQIVETGPARTVTDHPLHPYTQTLIAAIPSADPRRRRQRVDVPTDVEAAEPEAGCPFAPRCKHRLPRCTSAVPPLAPEQDRQVACFLYPGPPKAAATPAGAAAQAAAALLPD